MKEEFKIILKHSTNGSVEETRSLFLSYNEGRSAGLEKYCKKKRKAFNSISTQNHNPSKCTPVFLERNEMLVFLSPYCPLSRSFKDHLCLINSPLDV